MYVFVRISFFSSDALLGTEVVLHDTQHYVKRQNVFFFHQISGVFIWRAATPPVIYSNSAKKLLLRNQDGNKAF
jgi:hypothetical protein